MHNGNGLKFILDATAEERWPSIQTLIMLVREFLRVINFKLSISIGTWSSGVMDGDNKISI